jgi:amino acid permease
VGGGGGRLAMCFLLSRVYVVYRLLSIVCYLFAVCSLLLLIACLLKVPKERAKSILILSSFADTIQDSVSTLQ